TRWRLKTRRRVKIMDVFGGLLEKAAGILPSRSTRTVCGGIHFLAKTGTLPLRLAKVRRRQFKGQNWFNSCDIGGADEDFSLREYGQTGCRNTGIGWIVSRVKRGLDDDWA